MNNKQYKLICGHCKSESIVVDSFSEWDSETQMWVTRDIYEKYFCEECEDEVLNIEWIELA